MTQNTSTEAVRCIAVDLADYPGWETDWQTKITREASDILCALADERDALREALQSIENTARHPPDRGGRLMSDLAWVTKHLERLQSGNTNHIDADIWMREAAYCIKELKARAEKADTDARAAYERGMEDAYEKVARWHDRKSTEAMQALHCGSENHEHRDARWFSRFHHEASKEIRALRELDGKGEK